MTSMNILKSKMRKRHFETKRELTLELDPFLFSCKQYSLESRNKCLIDLLEYKNLKKQDNLFGYSKKG